MVRIVTWGLLLASVLLQPGCQWSEYPEGGGPGGNGDAGSEGAGPGSGWSDEFVVGAPPELPWLEGHGSFEETFDAAEMDLARWRLSNNWASSEDFNAGWRADHVWLNGGKMELRLDTTPCPEGCSGHPYASGETASTRYYGYGRYEVRMKPARGSGTLTSFCIYTGPAENTRWDGIDIAFVGLNTRRVQTNYVVNGKGYYRGVDLPFDASEDFHTYGIEWTREALHWYVDGKRVQSAVATNGPLPSMPGRILMNFWPGIGPSTESWMGSFRYPGTPLISSYDGVRHGLAAPKELVEDFETSAAWKVSAETGSWLTPSLQEKGHLGGALSVVYSIATSSRASATRTFDTPKDWSGGRYLSFWFRGTNTGDPFRLELRANGSGIDTAERFEYRFKDDVNGWKWVNVPLSSFTRNGQPVRSSQLTTVRGLSIEPLAGKGHYVLFDDLELER